MNQSGTIALQIIIDCEVTEIGLHLFQAAQEWQILTGILALVTIPTVLPFEIFEQLKAQRRDGTNQGLDRIADSHPQGNRCVLWHDELDWNRHLVISSFVRTKPLSCAITRKAEGISGGILVRWAVRIDWVWVLGY